MGFISLLPERVFNKIAAGEVVERPSSVVKELVENSIDAGSTSIKVSIEKSGMKSITILDNGSGMDSDDAILCFEPHATSKIRAEGDIFNISTMGFRGEAMPSIASVSKVRMKTRRHDAIEGTEIIISGGKFLSQNPAGCACGTEITVSELFFNVPARKKFLKGEATEEKHIYETVLMLALANSTVSFEFRCDGKSLFTSPGSKEIFPRLSLFLGKEIADNSIYFSSKRDGYEVYGYISKPSMTRSSRREQRFFVNHRPIRSLLLSSAVRDGYGAHVMHGVYPVVTIFVNVPVTDVDVNVHPAKHEVRFRKESQISALISEAVREALMESISPVTSVSISKFPLTSVIDCSIVSYVPSVKPQELPLPSYAREKQPEKTAVNESTQISSVLESPVRQTSFSLPGCGYLRVIDILNRTYILADSDIGLVVIDQHAAHERILFERLLKDYAKSNMRQELLIPITVDLSRTELQILRKYLKSFDKTGFGLEFFGENTVLVHSIPSVIRSDNISALISNILNSLLEQKPLMDGGSDEALIAKNACSLAVKANDKMSIAEASQLIFDLSKCDLPFNCPHGRPTVINISFKELEKRFGRIV